MTKKAIYTILAALGVLLLSACEDYIEYESGDIPEGESMVQFKLNFKDFTPALDSRAAGDAIKSIEQLWIVIYKSDGTFYMKRNVSGDFTIKSNTRPDGQPQAETETGHAEFKMTLPNGSYRIYAVANMDLGEEDVTTEEKLRNVHAQWNPDVAKVTENAEMFGWFSNAGKDHPNQGFDAETVVVAPDKTTIHAWLYRLASKVTVAFDGSGLYDGVSIYVKKLRIRNVVRSCTLGKDNKATGADDVFATGEEVTYTSDESAHGPVIENKLPYYPRIQKTEEDGTVIWIKDPDSHSETNPNSLFFYENMQGEGPDKRQLDVNNDGILDNLYDYKELAQKATYIEVETYYVSTNSEHPGVCNITYRFMLGQDVIKDYDAKRNCHYKLTLRLKGFADEPDWRIDYVTRIGASQPNTVNYKGEYFVPDSNIPNLGENFKNDNTITVTSYQYKNDSWVEREPVPYKVEYRDAGSANFTTTPPSWLDEFTTTEEPNGVFKLKINYKNPSEPLNINNKLVKNGERTGIYDLSTNGGSTTMSTANCYIVNAKGTYQFPLVYGNAITDDKTIESSYKYQGWGTGEKYLAILKNYKDEEITQPYIIDDIYGNAANAPTNLKAELVWQDEQNLVTGIQYEAKKYDGRGAIQFTIGTIKEGNAVIALKDPSGTVMWSWHIWVTAVGELGDITLTSHENQKFDIMPVNLGWCSGNKDLRIYKRHECEVRFTQLISEGDGVSQTVKIIQEPHIAVPRGNNPYYQWGRKDPFVAGTSNSTNKTCYTPSGTKTDNPERISPAGADSLLTKDATAIQIQNPMKWQNCPRIEQAGGTQYWPYKPADEIYFNLWDNSCWDDNDIVVKTVYDPCPVGYNVSSYRTFTGFTASGDTFDGTAGNPATEQFFAATKDNMLEDYREGLFEFYTDRSKLISIAFPQNGYRDWADDAMVHTYHIGQVWHAQGTPFDWALGFTSYYMQFHRMDDGKTSHVRPWANFYANDGFAVRPTIMR